MKNLVMVLVLSVNFLHAMQDGVVAPSNRVRDRLLYVQRLLYDISCPGTAGDLDELIDLSVENSHNSQYLEVLIEMFKEMHDTVSEFDNADGQLSTMKDALKQARKETLEEKLMLACSHNEIKSVEQRAMQKLSRKSRRRRRRGPIARADPHPLRESALVRQSRVNQ